tara:strand:+ start:1286 stop:1603 length:318 start_codon:yes stop_codon:yes gene_type:complete
MKKFKQIQTISDPSLEPYFITKDEHCFTIKENVSPNSNHFRTQGKGKDYEKSLFYFPTFQQALERIATLQLSQKENYNNLQDYLEKYNLISNQIKQYTDGIRSTV